MHTVFFFFFIFCSLLIINTKPLIYFKYSGKWKISYLKEKLNTNKLVVRFSLICSFNSDNFFLKKKPYKNWNQSNNWLVRYKPYILSNTYLIQTIINLCNLFLIVGPPRGTLIQWMKKKINCAGIWM
jgi:hypothetical protein